MAKYSGEGASVNGGVTIITGRGLTKFVGQASAWERALLAADLHEQRAHLIRPTIHQCSVAADVSAGYVVRALRLKDPSQRERVRGRLEPFLKATALTGNGGNGHDAESLADHMLRASPDELLAAAKAMGPRAIWDSMVSPLV
jgi:hypothetical protein